MHRPLTTLLTALVAAAALVTSACVTDIPAASAAGLSAFDGCGDLLRWAREEAGRRATPSALPGHGPVYYADGVGAGRGGAAAGGGEDRSKAASPVEGTDFSGTNVQEAGIDEADLVETDGRHLFTVQDGTLRVLAVADGVPREVARVPLEDAWRAELILAADRLAVVVPAGPGGPAPMPGRPTGDVGGFRAPDGSGDAGRTKILLYDVADAARPRLLARYGVEGTYQSARRHDDVLQLVVTSSPRDLGFVSPSGPSPAAEAHALEVNRKVVKDSGVSDWLPDAAREDLRKEGNRPDTGPALRCPSVFRPERFSGLDVTTVVGLDLTDALRVRSSAGVAAGSSFAGGEGSVVSASPGNLYLATTEWSDPSGSPRDARPRTTVHAFSTADPDAFAYAASGEIEGRLLNQFSMSEHEGVLRVASTSYDQSESAVEVFRRDGRTLGRIGRVGGLGENERIYSVRFLGDLGYVVTFRQTDPLYVVDIGDPARPVVRGELKIPGFSSYLHPVDDGRLLGVGQDATAEGRRQGTKLSLFDVADPTSPREVAGVAVGEHGSSEVEADHHAFLWWPRTGTVVVPTSRVRPDAEGAGAPDTSYYEEGLAVVRLDADRLASQGFLTHDVADDAGQGPSTAIRRAVVVGDVLLSISAAGVAGNRLDDLTRTAWVGFGD